MGTFNNWETVLIASSFDKVLYGWTTGNPKGVIHPTGELYSPINLAQVINHFLIWCAPVKRFEIAFKVNFVIKILAL